jgi:hypothetical protein
VVIGSNAVPPNIGNFDSTQNVHYENALGAAGDNLTVYGYLRIYAAKAIVPATFIRLVSDNPKEFETVAIDLGIGKRTAPDCVH